MLELDPDDPRPVWLLDVDGVLNTSRNAWHEAPYHAQVAWGGRPWDGHEDRSMTFKFHWSPTLLKRIHRARADRLVELVWCTTWCAEAHSLEAIWKLPPLKRAFNCYTASQADAWTYKVSAAERVLAVGRRLIWTDDDIPAFGPLRDRFTRDGALLIQTEARRGLTPEHMDQIEAFACAGAEVSQ